MLMAMKVLFCDLKFMVLPDAGAESSRYPLADTLSRNMLRVTFTKELCAKDEKRQILFSTHLYSLVGEQRCQLKRHFWVILLKNIDSEPAILLSIFTAAFIGEK